jgi:hypothetical protein
LQLAVCALALGGGCRPPTAPQPAALEPKPSSEHRVSVSADAEVEVIFDEAATGTVVQGTVVADIEDAAVHTTAGDPQSDASSPATQRSAPGDCNATVPSFDETAAHAAGSLLGRTRTEDVVDASVVTLSIRHGADIVSGDVEDLSRLLSSARAKAMVLDV